MFHKNEISAKVFFKSSKGNLFKEDLHMRLRNLFMILLLCMTVGMFGVSCTGDDGAQGPPGPAGPAGPAGPGAGDGEAPEETNRYGFLTGWGSETGEIACSDPILTDSGPLPGPDLVDLMESNRTDDDATTDVDEEALNAAIVVNCGTRFDDTTMIDVGGATPTSVDGTDRHMVFWKTGRAQEKDEAVRKPVDDFGPATSTVETRDFVGGLVFAKLMNNGPSEAFERGLLSSNCPDVGTPAPEIRGHWRAVKKTKSVTTYNLTTKEPITPSAEMVTLTKFCVVLDAHPGVTKCYVEEGAAPNTTMRVALYDGENLETVVAQDDLSDNASTATTAADLFNSSDDFTGVENLCNLFGTR